MTGFSADWLDRREPYDLRARSPVVLNALAASLADHASLAIVDLACGAGATVRAISSRLAPQQTWRLVDNDLRLLARAAAGAGKNAATLAIDIARDLETALDAPADLVTVSAMLDLVSARWLDRLVAALAGRGLPFYAALTYDGRVTFEPADARDASLIAAVNRHQRRDKGFGPALGPAAAAEAIARFKGRDYGVVQGFADWILAPHDQAIQADLLAGWSAAAIEGGESARGEVEEWLARRRDHLAAARSTIRVGHIDFFSRPIGTRSAVKSQSNSRSSSSA